MFTSGDAPDVLVAMNPAALKTNLADVKYGGMVIVNTGAFTAANLEKAGYHANPLEDGSCRRLSRLYPIDISALTAQRAGRTRGSAEEGRRRAARTTSRWA